LFFYMQLPSREALSPKGAMIKNSLMGYGMKIHLIETDSMNFNLVQNDMWESGWWTLNKDQAELLIGSEIFFHKTRTEPSFYGGIIRGFRVEPEGEKEGQIVFEFQYNKICRDIRTDRNGWARKMKIVREAEE